MRQKNYKSSLIKPVQYNTLFFESINSTSMWVQSNGIDNNSLFQGRLLLKCDEKWESMTLDLHPERLYKKSGNQEEFLSYCQLQACYLKKFTHYDPSMPNYRYGIRLQFGQQMSYLLSDNSDIFRKWLQFLRRFCILDKFNRKYKVLGKVKHNDPVFGQCSFSCVKVQDASYFIAKIIEKGLLNTPQKQNLFREVSNLRKMSHTQICYFVELFEDEQNVYLLYEYFAGVDLRTYLKESQIYYMAEQSTIGLDEKLLADTIYGLLQAVNHMHGRGVFHRDIKLDNIFIPDKKRLPFVILGNFCYSETTDQQQYKKCGTPGFVAPEIFKSKNYTNKVDIFSLGVVFFLLIFGKLPFEGKEQEEILKSNEKCEIDFKIEKKLCKKISNSGIDLLKCLLNKDPMKRLSATQALNHHWFIKMGTKHQRNQLQVQKGRSLSTIIENSVDITQRQHSIKNNSCYQSNSRLHQSTKEDDRQDRVDKEFFQESLYEKLMYFNSIQYQPSKIRHQ